MLELAELVSAMYCMALCSAVTWAEEDAPSAVHTWWGPPVPFPKHLGLSWATDELVGRNHELDKQGFRAQKRR